MFATNLTRLPEVLRANAFKTAAISAMGNVASEIGFGRGFDRYCDLFREPSILAKRQRVDAAKEGLMHATNEEVALPSAEDINEYLFPWLEEQHTSDTFTFIWSIETHVPYTPPDKFRRFSDPSHVRPNEGERRDIRIAGAADRERLMSLYDDVIYYNDYCLGRIVSYLKTLNIYDDTLLIIVGDHGDAFYEHGFYAHGRTPYEELIHVPMIAKLPGGHYAGRRVAGLAELIDIFPMVMALVKPAPGTWDRTYLQGHNLLPMAAGTQDHVRECVFSDTQPLEIHSHYQSVRSHRWKYIERQRPKRDRRTLAVTIRHIFKRRMFFDVLCNLRHFLHNYFSGSNQYLFDLKTDPGEQWNLAAERPDVIRQLRQVLISWQQRNSELARQVGASPYSYAESEMLRRHLEQLGYL
jgi:arylsulfatase A-like enzyme